MPDVARLPETRTTTEGFTVTTEAGGTVYTYLLRITDERIPAADVEEGQEIPGTVLVTERTKDGEVVEPAATDAVRDVMDEHGYEVEV